MDVEQRARELLRSEYMLSLSGAGPKQRHQQRHLYECAVRAITAALTPPEGCVLVPVEPTEGMVEAHDPAYWHTPADDVGTAARKAWAAMLSARPEVKP